jgi:hypothetical protein
MKKIATMFLFAFLAAGARADDLPDTPKPKVADKDFWLLAGALAAAKTTDAITTERFLGRGCHELNSLLGPHPSAGKLAANASAYYAGELALAYGLKRFGRRHRRARFLWIAEPLYGIARHVQLSASNEALVCP